MSSCETQARESLHSPHATPLPPSQGIHSTLLLPCFPSWHSSEWTPFLKAVGPRRDGWSSLPSWFPWQYPTKTKKKAAPFLHPIICAHAPSLCSFFTPSLWDPDKRNMALPEACCWPSNSLALPFLCSSPDIFTEEEERGGWLWVKEWYKVLKSASCFCVCFWNCSTIKCF